MTDLIRFCPSPSSTLSVIFGQDTPKNDIRRRAPLFGERKLTPGNAFMYSEINLDHPTSVAALSAAEPALGSAAYRKSLADYIEGALLGARLGDSMSFGPGDFEVILDALREAERSREQRDPAAD